MKRTFILVGLSLVWLAAMALAQNPMDEQSEKSVQITQGPTISGITGTSATINWTTNKPGANHVRYRVAGSNSAWKSAYHSGGGTSHSLQLTGLEPGKAYEWQILTRDGDLRTSGQFQSAATANGTAPDVNAGSTPPAGAPGGGAGDTSSGAKVPLYRALNTGPGGAHVYSTNSGDLSSQGLRPEGVAGYVMSSQGSGTVPLYRLVNANGDNLLTIDANEKASAISSGYRDHGIVGYVASSQVAGTQPFYRMATSNGATHFYTASAGEHSQVIGQGGWVDQGTAGYIWTQP
jgi:uncharacterized protein DUF5648/purple acid phosphatase-like protein